MYFDLEPKSVREDLYDFDEQFNKLLDLLRGERARAPMVVIIGPRRAGKTSLLQTALGESGVPHLILNGMAFAEVPVIRRRSLLRALERELNDAIERERKWGKKFLDILKGIRWLKVNSKPPWIHFEWERPDEEFDLLEILQSFNRLARDHGTKFVFVLDEAQEFRRLKGYRLQALMAYTYDYLKNVQMIVTGSQFGFLHDFLEVDDPDSPLYGRGMVEVRVPRITSELAADFLSKGLKQAGIKPDEDAITSAVRELDGIMGWLTLFGSESVGAGCCTREILRKTIEKGSKIAANEFKNFLRTREQARSRYIRILRSAARLKCARWVDLKRDLELEERKKISNNVFSDLVDNLVRGGFLEKNEDGTYSIADPLLGHAIRSGLVR
ncbi:MAG: ATP-binding protein [Candidatus Hadarchaeales archaeon]